MTWQKLRTHRLKACGKKIKIPLGDFYAVEAGGLNPRPKMALKTFYRHSLSERINGFFSLNFPTLTEELGEGTSHV